MDMAIVTGFLGSGKTTMILSVIERINELKNHKVAIIVNDFGNIGIDAKVMNKFGLQVKELQGGCICCTLGSFLLDTVQNVVDNFSPDLIIIEPTGIADPKSILATMERYDGHLIENINTLVLMDAPRFETHMKVLKRPFEHLVEAADMIAVNKIDEVGEESVNEVVKTLRDIGYDKNIIPTSATVGTNLDSVVKFMVNS